MKCNDASLFSFAEYQLVILVAVLFPTLAKPLVVSCSVVAQVSLAEHLIAIM